MTEPTIQLSELLFDLSPLNKRHAELLSERWASDVVQELKGTGVSVISGLGTLSAGKDGISFQLDKELPIAPDLPGVEGYSETGASAHAALLANSRQTFEKPEVTSDDPGEYTSSDAELLTNDGNDLPHDTEGSRDTNSTDAAQSTDDIAADLAEHDQALGDSDLPNDRPTTLPAADDEEAFEAGLAAAMVNAEASIEPVAESFSSEEEDHAALEELSKQPVSHQTPSEKEDTEAHSPDEATLSEEPTSPEEAASRKQSSDSPSSRLAPDNAPIPGGSSSDDAGKKESKQNQSAESEPKPTSSVEEAAARRKEASTRMPTRAGRRRAGVRSHRNEPDRRGLMIVAGMLIVVVISIAGFWALRTGSGPATNDSIASEEQSEVGQADGGEMDAGTSNDLQLDPTQSETGDIIPKQTTADDSQQPASSDDSLPSTASETDSNTANGTETRTSADPSSAESTVATTSITADTPGYMLVVGSTLNQAEADRSLAQYASLGLPTGVIAYDDDGVMRYRMGVGIYPSASAADGARTQLADRLPEGTWVKRIR